MVYMPYLYAHEMTSLQQEIHSNNSKEWSRFWEANGLLPSQEMEPKSPLPCLKESTNGPYPEPD